VVQFLGHPAGLALIPVINWRYINHLITGLITPLRRVFKIGGGVGAHFVYLGRLLHANKSATKWVAPISHADSLALRGGGGIDRMEENMMYLGMEDIAVGRVKENDERRKLRFNLLS